MFKTHLLVGLSLQHSQRRSQQLRYISRPNGTGDLKTDLILAIMFSILYIPVLRVYQVRVHKAT